MESQEILFWFKEIRTLAKLRLKKKEKLPKLCKQLSKILQN